MSTLSTPELTRLSHTLARAGFATFDYFAPLKAWLDEQIAGQPAGW